MQGIGSVHKNKIDGVGSFNQEKYGVGSFRSSNAERPKRPALQPQQIQEEK